MGFIEPSHGRFVWGIPISSRFDWYHRLANWTFGILVLEKGNTSGDLLTYAAFLTWLKDNQIGDITGLLSLLGLGLTVWTGIRSKRAAEIAAAAAENARNSIRALDTFIDLSEAISLLEQIKRDHRVPALSFGLLERYSRVKGMLIRLNETRRDLSDQQAAAIQGSITMLRQMEKELERAQLRAPDGNAEIPIPRWNSLISNNIEELLRVLAQLKALETETRT